MKEHDQIKKQLMLAAIFFLVSLAAYLLLVYAVFGVVAQHEKLRGEAEIAQEKERRLILLKKELSAYSKDRTLVDNLFVDKKSIPEFIGAIEMTAQIVGAELSVNSLQTSAQDGKTALVVDYTATGSFPALSEHLRLLDTLPYVLNIGKVSFTKAEGGVWRLAVIVRLQSYLEN